MHHMFESFETRRSALRAIGVTTMITAALTGCAGEGTAGRPVVESAQPLNLIAQLEGDNGAQVNFYEPEPGHVLVLELGHMGETPLISADLAKASAVAKWEALSGQAAPIALIEAEQREQLGVNELGFVAPVENVEQAPIVAQQGAQDGVGVSSQALTRAEFVSYYCNPASNYDYEAFWQNVTGTGSYTWTQLNYIATGALSLRGDIKYRVRWRPRASWSGYTTVWLPAGYYATYYEAYRDILGFGWNSIVDNAEGDLYHFCSWGDHTTRG
jgi:hypothetical protein